MAADHLADGHARHMQPAGCDVLPLLNVRGVRLKSGRHVRYDEIVDPPYR